MMTSVPDTLVTVSGIFYVTNIECLFTFFRFMPLGIGYSS